MTREKTHGNTDGIRNAVLEELDALFDEQLPAELFLTSELMQKLADFTFRLNREIALYVTRDGEVVDVIIGSDRDVSLQDMRLRRNQQRLSRIRCIHTHPNSSGKLSDLDLTALKSYRYDAMAAIGVKDGKPTTVQAAFLVENEQLLVTEECAWKKLPASEWMEQVLRSDELVGVDAISTTAQRQERVMLMGIESESSLQELARLAETAGGMVVGSFLQKKDKPDRALFIGKGRAEELSRQCQALEADVCIFDEELSGIQTRNLEECLHVKVIDRTTLILDIFAQRAQSAEGKLQVELAQLQYRSARLIGQGMILSRLAGGIGTRGPGESKLEVSRRRIRERITDLKQRLAQIEKQRALRRVSRQRNEIPVVALVGYTNAGKSSLLGAISGSDVFAKDQLFATLDSLSRRVETAEGTPYLLVDTVGFIRKLPHTLVNAFRSTLEEAALADVLVIVSDASSREIMQQRDTVDDVLAELNALDQPRIEALNKCDLSNEPSPIPGGILVSAKTGTGLDALKAAIAGQLQATHQTVTYFIPFQDYGVLGQIRKLGKISEEAHDDLGTTVTLKISQADQELIRKKWGLTPQTMEQQV